MATEANTKLTYKDTGCLTVFEIRLSCDSDSKTVKHINLLESQLRDAIGWLANGAKNLTDFEVFMGLDYRYGVKTTIGMPPQATEMELKPVELNEYRESLISSLETKGFQKV